MPSETLPTTDDTLLGTLTKPPKRGVGKRGPDRNPGTRKRKRTAWPKLKPQPYGHGSAYLSRGKPIIRWTIERQAQAVGEGWFFERDMFTNYVRLVAIPQGALITAELAWAHIERETFRNSLFHALAIAFVQQQLTHQYSDGWDRTVQRYSRVMRWYKVLAKTRREYARARAGWGRR